MITFEELNKIDLSKRIIILIGVVCHSSDGIAIQKYIENNYYDFYDDYQLISIDSYENLIDNITNQLSIINTGQKYCISTNCFITWSIINNLLAKSKIKNNTEFFLDISTVCALEFENNKFTNILHNICMSNNTLLHRSLNILNNDYNKILSKICKQYSIVE